MIFKRKSKVDVEDDDDDDGDEHDAEDDIVLIVTVAYDGLRSNKGLQ